MFGSHWVIPDVSGLLDVGGGAEPPATIVMLARALACPPCEVLEGI
jgi:hypothetical protein